jgi:hypothetical protein
MVTVGVRGREWMSKRLLSEFLTFVKNPVELARKVAHVQDFA